MKNNLGFLHVPVLGFPFAFSNNIIAKKLSSEILYFFFQGQCDVTPEGYHHLTKLLTNVANGKIIIVLEVN